MNPRVNGEPRYGKEAFEDPPKMCDLVMKGGVTSGVVYPYAVLQLATQYRFRSIGGTSAVAIAAAFAAAAEFGRQSGDAGAFTRFETRCLEIPAILESLFQPTPALRPLMRALQAISKAPGLRGWLSAYLEFLVPAAIGAGVGAGAMALSALVLAQALTPEAAPGVALGVRACCLAPPSDHFSQSCALRRACCRDMASASAAGCRRARTHRP